MSEASFASLGPTLLARKGGAKPAMRPQLAPLTHTMAEMAALADEQLEDLGWNDMGAEDDAEANPAQSVISAEAGLITAATAPANSDDADFQEAGADIVQIESRMNRPTAANEDTPEANGPVLNRNKNKSAGQIMAGATMKSNGVKSPEAQLARQKAKAQKRRAAFTLRLDTERHLKLRLASTMLNRSAQAIVTDALDAALAKIKDLDVLVSRMQRD